MEHVLRLQEDSFYFQSVSSFMIVTCKIQITFVLFSHLKLILQLNCETSRIARVYYFKSCDGWAGEQIVVCTCPLTSFISFSFLYLNLGFLLVVFI